METLVCDISHGGTDPGAMGKSENRPKESDITYSIGKRVSELLSAHLAVITTRQSDIDVSLGRRADIANEAKADFFLSIHCNAANDTSVGGVETWYYRDDSTGKLMAKMLQARLTTALGLSDRGVKECVPGDWSDFYVLKHTAMPAALVEIGFLSNPGEEALLVTAEFQERAAVAIAQAICDYKGVRLFSGPTINIKGKVYKGAMVNNALHGPVRAMFTQLGYNVRWDAATQTAYIE